MFCLAVLLVLMDQWHRNRVSKTYRLLHGKIQPRQDGYSYFSPEHMLATLHYLPFRAQVDIVRAATIP